MSDDAELLAAVHALLGELLDGAPEGGAYILNPGDRGLLRSLDGLSASAASVVPAGGTSSIAAHVDHLRYGLSLLNRWFDGDPNPFKDADYGASWDRTVVTETEWMSRRSDLAREARKWVEALMHPKPL
ncbi:MAG: DinB family protein, partial [Vicinamibacterales bacterium]